MIKFTYYWAKLFKKLHSRAIVNSTIDKTSKVEAGSELVNVTMSKHSFCGYNCEIINCEIGSFTSIANNVVIGGGMHPMDWVSMSPVFYEGKDSVKAKYSVHKRPLPLKIIIGHDVWIGHSAIIKAGVSIGTGAVIGMGSIVTKDVEPYTVVAGNPARFIKNRFVDEVKDQILKSEWWNYSDEHLKEYGAYFNNPKEFFKLVK